MKIITLTYTDKSRAVKFLINCDKIHLISRDGSQTWINLGNENVEFRVDQTPEEILELINGGNK